MPSSTDFARSIATTIVNHLREEEIASLRKYMVFAAIESRGNIRMNMAGRGFDWEVSYRLHQPQGNNGETPRSFSRQNLWKKAELEYRGYQATDMIYRKELLENRGTSALVNVAGKMASRLLTSIEQYLSQEVWNDGSASGNELRYHGLESFLGNNGTLHVTDGTQRSANAADPFAFPSDTYAGLNTQLGYYGGSQLTGTWPGGKADSEYDFYSPILVNYTSTFWGGSSATWAENCVKAIRAGLHYAKRNDTKEDAIDLVVLDRKLYIDFLNKQDSKERVIVSRENGLRSFGFNTVEIDGVEVGTEYAVPADTGYGLAIGNIELLNMESQMYNSEGPFYDEVTQSYRYCVSTLGNMKFKSPRSFIKFKNYA
jgi:hypothetical protein